MTGFVPNWAAGITTLNVLDFGADPTNTNDSQPAIQACFDAAFGPASSPNAALNAILNKAVCVPPGQYKLLRPLVLTQVHGGHIFGTGARGSVLITLTGTGSSSDTVIQTDGFEYSKVENIAFNIGSNQTVGTVFALDRLSGANPVNIQSNTFVDCDFGSGEVGMWIDKTVAPSSQGSENSFINCFFTGSPGTSPFSGLRIKGQNALANCVWGGDFQHHSIGIDVPVTGGACPIIHGVSFQSNGSSTAIDIQILTSSPDDYSIIGCRSESVNFAYFSGGSGVNIENSYQTNGVGGAFLFSDAGVTLSGCHIGGQFYGTMNLAVDNCFFTSATPWTGSAGTFGGVISRWHSVPAGSIPGRGPWTPGARFAFSNLPPASMCPGMRHYIVDSSAAASGNFANTASASTTIASFTGTIDDGAGNAGIQLNVSSGTGLAVGQVVRGTNVHPGTIITGGSGTAWTVLPQQQVSSEAMTTGAGNTVPVWSDGTNWRIG